jgi:hypothetical protein
MSDQTETAAPRPLKVTSCFDPTGRTVSCYALVEDTDQARREHRLWHKHEESVKEGMRKAIKERDEEIGKLSREVGDAQRDVKGIVIPEPVLGIEISRDGWAADDEDDYDDDPRSIYADDDLAFSTSQVRAAAAAAFTTDDHPDDDGPFASRP